RAPGGSRKLADAGTVPGVTVPPAPLDAVANGGGAATLTAGVASLAVRDLLRGPRRHGRVLAVRPHAVYLEFAGPVPEPRVIAISPPDAPRLPNAIITGWRDVLPAVPPKTGLECWAGGSRV